MAATEVEVSMSPETVGDAQAYDVEVAMSPETLGDTQAYNSSMSLPLQTGQGQDQGQGQLGNMGETQDLGPVSAVYTTREVYVTPGGEVTEQVTEYSTTTTTMQLGFDPYYNVAAAVPGYDQMNPTSGYGVPGYCHMNPNTGYGAPEYEQMNPSAGYGNQAFYGTTGGMDFGAHGGIAVSNPDICTDPTASTNVGTAGGGSHPAETTTETTTE